MYKKATWEYGNIVEIKKYHTFGCPQKGISRKKSVDKSGEEIRKRREKLRRYNEQQANKELERTLAANFTEEDFHCVLTYREAPEAEGDKRIFRNFLQRLRRFYVGHGTALKFVAVVEQEAKRIHHHFVCNGIAGINMARELNRIWGQGGVHLTPLYEDRDYKGLAEYLVKETRRTFQKEDGKTKQRYTCSRNLVRPEPVIKTIAAEHWSDTIKVPKGLEEKGYYLDRDSIRAYEDWAGYMNVEYKFIKPSPQELRREKKRAQQVEGYMARFLKKGRLKEEVSDERRRL